MIDDYGFGWGKADKTVGFSGGGENTAEKEQKMENTRKAMILVILAGLFASGLAIAATADVANVVAGRGWDMGACRIPIGTDSTAGVYFVSGEIIDMPIHINNQNDSPDVRDIYIKGSPVFTERVEMGESRYTAGGTDKYETVMSCFLGGIDFDVPDSNINDEAAVQRTIDRYRDSTLTAYRFEPNLNGCPTTSPFNLSSYKSPAVQLEFYIDTNGVGKVRITNNCAVRLMDPGIYDYNIVTGSGGIAFQKYKIYGYHYKPNDSAYQTTVPIIDTYVTQTIGGYTSDPGGQIYVNGNVIIGGDSNSSTDPNQVVKGTITVVATGNIWIADSIFVDGAHDENGLPAGDNPNFLNLIAQGVIKVVDTGKSPTSPSSVSGYTYQPIGNSRSGYTGRWLPHDTIVEAAITVGGGGWGAENVNTSGGRKVYSPPMDDLYVHGAIAEVLRGIVGVISVNGYMKHYSYDRRSRNPADCYEAVIGDLNGDCTVDFEDFAIMAVHWLESNFTDDSQTVCVSPIEGDVNRDCMVDFIDFAILVGHWLECNLEP
jgi:hypothetical protein